MKLVYGVKDKPKFGQLLVFAFQQLLAILAATIAVPSIVGNGMSQSAALFGAGVGTIVYLLFTKFKSPVFLGSSFAFLGSMFAAFAGGVYDDVKDAVEAMVHLDETTYTPNSENHKKYTEIYKKYKELVKLFGIEKSYLIK